ncbi:hypothetical protein HDU98_003419 [Podochytrium sp. JEL0797]|nr:hypothetical protein HDU98_003419 [Podochytrium sp. JEL0797]
MLFRTCTFLNAYCFIHVVADQLYGKHAEKKFHLTFSERISVSEKVCSTINAIYTASAAIWISFVRDSFNVDHMIATPCSSRMSGMLNIYPKAPETANAVTQFFDMDWVLPAFIAYSIYDCATMYFQGDNHWSMWVHHIVGIYGGVGNVIIRKLSVLSTFAMMTEITAFFVNLLWYFETLNLSRPQPIPYRRASITLALGDSETPEGALTPSTQDVPGKTAPPPSAAAVASALRKAHRKSTKPPPTLLLVTLQTLRTLSFLIFRVTAVPFSFYLILSRGNPDTFPSFSVIWEMIVVVWNGCSACPREWWDWDLDRGLGFSALVVQLLFGLLNVVWTLVAFKVLGREVRGYLKKTAEKKKKQE